MKKVLSLLVLFALVLSIGLVATGCKGSTDNGGGTASGDFADAIPGGSADVSAETLQALSESGTVRIYDYSETYTDAEKKFDEYFSTVYGGKVERINLQWSYWERTFVTHFAGGDAPDVVYLFSRLWPKAASRSFVYSKSELAEKGVVGLDHPLIERTAELAERNYGYNGNVYAVDVYRVTPATMLVNDTLLKECGIEKTPKDYYKEGQWNWDTFKTVLASVAKIDKDNDGSSDYCPYYCDDPAYILDANEGYLIKMDETGKLYSNIRDTKVVNGMQNYVDLYTNKYHVAKGEFEEGKTATYTVNDYNVAKKINNNGKGLNFEWSVVPYPKGADNSNGDLPGGTECYAVVSSSENLQGSVNFIIAQAAYNDTYAEVNPATDLKYWLDDEDDQMLDDMRLKVYEKTFTGVADIYSTHWDFWQSMEKGKYTVQEVISSYEPWLKAQVDIENAYAEN